MDEIKVLTWNIRHCEKGDGTIDVLAFIREAAKADADVVLLQEVDRGVKRSLGIDQLVAFRNELGPGWVPLFAKRLDLENGLYGIAALTRLPIIESKAYLLSDIREEKCVAQKVIVSVGDDAVSIYNFHMPEGVGPHSRLAWKRLSRMQFDRNSIIAGDFNAKKLNENLSECMDIGKQSTSDWGRIDYCIGSGTMIPIHQEVVRCRLSDHYPVLTTFKKTFETL